MSRYTKSQVTITVHTLERENPEAVKGMLNEFAARIKHIAAEEWMPDGVDLMGYDGPLIRKISTKVSTT